MLGRVHGWQAGRERDGLGVVWRGLALEVMDGKVLVWCSLAFRWIIQRFCLTCTIYAINMSLNRTPWSLRVG